MIYAQRSQMKSASIYEEAKKYIPGGVNSPARSFSTLRIPPIVVKEGRGDTITDVDGNTYIDFCGSWGALIHGHAHPYIIEKVAAQLIKGTSFGITTEIEGKIAKRIVTDHPSLEKIRFVSSGTEATMSALRLARGYTGRDAIVKFSGCYHGHGDLLLVQAGSGVAKLNAQSTSKGVPLDAIKNTMVLPFNDLTLIQGVFRNLGSTIAAVIVEPVAANMGVVPPKPGFLELISQLTKEYGALLIFDEVVTGYRVGPKGWQGVAGIDPDLTCFGKIIGGGFPAAAFGGKSRVMDCLAPLGEVYQAGTLSGNPVAMEAGEAALSLLTPSVYSLLEEKSKFLLDPIQSYIKKRGLNVALQRVGSMFTIFFGASEVKDFDRSLNLEQYRAFYSFLLEREVYFSPAQYEANFISTAHTEDHLAHTREVILDFFEHVF